MCGRSRLVWLPRWLPVLPTTRSETEGLEPPGSIVPLNVLANLLLSGIAEVVGGPRRGGGETRGLQRQISTSPERVCPRRRVRTKSQPHGEVS
jgi:hypothetical protein